MKSAVIVFPASNCDRDAKVALEEMTGKTPAMVWHQDSELPDVDLVVLPGGFSYGDYLRCGAMASQSNVMREVKRHADKGGKVLGICNGFQVLTESHLLPGALMRNAALKFVCKPVGLEVSETQSAFTRKYENGQRVTFPVAHGEGALEIGFNARYLLDIASQLESEDARFLLADPGSPTMVRDGGDDGALYVLMPMRV